MGSIDFDACLRARSTLARVPANRSKLYKRASRPQPRKCTSRSSGMLSILRLIAVNPAQGLRSLRRDDISDAEKRIPFTPEQIIAFFNSEFYRRCVASGPAPHRFDTKGWRFGCRLSACSAACAPTRSAASALES